MLKFFKYTLLLILFSSGALQAQELNALVRIDASQVQTTETRVFRDMETQFARFLNDRKWSQDEFDYNEKINVNIQIVLNPSDRVGVYSGTLVIQAARPVYNSSYITSTFFFRDNDFNFEYVESQPMDFNINNFQSNLTSVLAFYANIILGMDYDTFSLQGGTTYFDVARNIQQQAQLSGGGGWDPSAGGNASRNRAALINNIINPQLEPIRTIMYNYHRLALDTFIDDPDESRRIVLEGLKKLKEVRSYNPSAIFLISFFDAKKDELANMFSKGDMSVRRQALELLTNMDPSRAEEYRKKINN